MGRRRGNLPQTPRVRPPQGLASCHVSDTSRSDVTRCHGAELPSAVSVVSPGPRSVSLPGLRCPGEVTFPGLGIRLPTTALPAGNCKRNVSGAWGTRGSGGPAGGRGSWAPQVCAPKAQGSAAGTQRGVRRPGGAEDPDLTRSSPGRGRWACATRSGPGALVERGFSPLPQKADTAVGGSSARPGSESLFPPAPFHVCRLTLRLFCGGGSRAWKGEIRSPGRGGRVLLPGQVRAGRWHSPNDAPSLRANGPPFTKRIKPSFPPGSA